MHPHEIADYLQQDRITVSFPECGPVSEVMAGIATLQRRLKELQGIQPGRCLGFVHRTQPDGTTIPISQVIEGPNGEWVDVPLPVVVPFHRQVNVMKLKWKTRTNRDWNLMFGPASLNINETELELLTDILIKRRQCQNKQTAARAAEPIQR